MFHDLHRVVRAFATRVAREPKTGMQPPRVFYVGGTVRDRFLGEEVRDVDCEVYGVPVRRVEEIFEELGVRDVGVFGTLFGVYKIPFQEGVLDIAFPRAESKNGKGHRGFAITGDPYLSFEHALQRRDFTMNAILEDVLTGEYIDPYHGRDDIAQGVLRVVERKTFSHDALRVYRAMQFLARFSVVPDEVSMACLRETASSFEVKMLSRERVTEEWKKMLTAQHSARGIRFLHDVGLLSSFPSLATLCTLAKDSQWHPEGSAWEHAVLCLQETDRTYARWKRDASVDIVALRLALLIHNIPQYTLREEFFGQFTFSHDTVRDSMTCARFHGALVNMYHAQKHEQWTDTKIVNALRMLWRDITVERIPLYLAMCEVHARGNARVLDDRPYPVRAWAEEYTARNALEEIAEKPLITGDDVRSVAERLSVSIPCGKEFGMLLAEIESARDRGVFITRADALLYLEKKLTF